MKNLFFVCARLFAPRRALPVVKPRNGGGGGPAVGGLTKKVPLKSLLSHSESAPPSSSKNNIRVRVTPPQRVKEVDKASAPHGAFPSRSQRRMREGSKNNKMTKVVKRRSSGQENNNSNNNNNRMRVGNRVRATTQKGRNRAPTAKNLLRRRRFHFKKKSNSTLRSAVVSKRGGITLRGRRSNQKNNKNGESDATTEIVAEEHNGTEAGSSPFLSALRSSAADDTALLGHRTSHANRDSGVSQNVGVETDHLVDLENALSGSIDDNFLAGWSDRHEEGGGGEGNTLMVVPSEHEGGEDGHPRAPKPVRSPPAAPPTKRNRQNDEKKKTTSGSARNSSSRSNNSTGIRKLKVKGKRRLLRQVKKSFTVRKERRKEIPASTSTRPTTLERKDKNAVGVRPRREQPLALSNNKKEKHKRTSVRKTKPLMFASVNHARFRKNIQDELRSVTALVPEMSSMFWITRAQALRTSNVLVRPGEAPTTIYLAVSAVIPLLSLSKVEQSRVLDEYPPFFSMGVGILSERRKWKVVLATRLSRYLNPKDEERLLFIDTAIAEDLKLRYNPESVISVKEFSGVEMFNAGQLEDPYKGMPQRGVAINVITGKRFPQPSHDLLLAVGILRGYISPFWIAEKQLKYLNLELRPEEVERGVLASEMSGLIVPLSSLPADSRRFLHRRLMKNFPDSRNHDLFFLFGPNGWEVSRSRVLVRHMVGLEETRYPYYFVNVTEFIFQFPEWGLYLFKGLHSAKPRGREYIEQAALEYYRQEAEDLQKREIKPKKKQDKEAVLKTLPNNLLFIQEGRLWGTTSFRYFFAEDATLRRYYNACSMTKPYLAVPSVRPIAIANGRVMGRRDEAILRTQSLKCKFSSPIWLTASAALKMGVDILPRERRRYALVGVEGSLQNVSKASEGFYNIDDFRDSGAILSMFPKSSTTINFMLDGKWRPVLGKFRQDYLKSLDRKTPLWISINECLMSGFEPLPDSRVLHFPKPSAKTLKKTQSSRSILYNSQQTTDPVRVIGLTTYLTRPQGGRS